MHIQYIPSACGEQLLRAAAPLLAARGAVLQPACIGDLPLFSQDLEPGPGGPSTLPASVLRFRAHAAASDALLFACPENNFSVSAALKNALDWGSRGTNLFAGKPAAVVAAAGSSGGGRGTAHLRTIGGCLNLGLIEQEVLVPQRFRAAAGGRVLEAGGPFDPSTGDVVCAAVVRQIEAVCEALLERATQRTTGYVDVPPARAQELLTSAGYVLLDVRSTGETGVASVACFSVASAPVMAGAASSSDTPAPELHPDFVARAVQQVRGAQGVVITCSSGKRGALAAGILAKVTGLPPLVHLAGGLDAWEAAGLPAISLTPVAER